MSTSTLSPSIIPSSIVPENAPFTEAQRAWLNGLFAGILGAQAGSAPAAAPAVEIEIEEEMPWHDPALALADRLKLADDRPHERKLMAAMAQLDCGSCGYLCKSYAEAIAAGGEKDLTKCTPGGRDTAKALKQLQAAAPKTSAPSPAKSKASSVSTQSTGAYDRIHPYKARVLHSQRLNGASSAKDTRHIAFDLRGSGITYKPGDALGVYAQNCPDLVDEILTALSASGAEDVNGFDDQPISFFEALTREFTITRPSPDLLDLMSRTASDPGEREALGKLRDNDDAMGDLHIIDLLHYFPSARPCPSDFVATLSPLAPRLYSISSAPSAVGEQVHLTVGTVKYDNSRGRACKGVASTFLGERARPGQKVRVFIQPSHRFALPDSHSTPVIMVGPGTGIAPFRAFLQHRAATKAPGGNWLFFGDQTADGDFLYRTELESWRDQGVLTRLDTAFSRDQAQKVYVQTRMIEHGAELWKWLEEGAHFYVCGDAKRMASDVDKALRQIISTHGSRSTEEADLYVSTLSRSGRYQRDVY